LESAARSQETIPLHRRFALWFYDHTTLCDDILFCRGRLCLWQAEYVPSYHICF
jgi:hypothetical protein